MEKPLSIWLIYHTHKGDRRTVGQSEHRIAVLLLSRRDNMLDRLRILAGKRNSVAMTEAEDSIITTGPGALNKIRARTGVDIVVARASVDRVGTATGVDRVITGAATEDVRADAAGDLVGACPTIDGLGASAAINCVVPAAAKDHLRSGVT